MNYEKIYMQLITRAKARVLEGYKERHHIIPKCLGGNNDKENLVDLTAREHYIAHLLLAEIYPKNKKIIYAAFMMASIGSTKQNSRNYIVSSRIYESLKLKKCHVMKGNIPWNKGKKGVMPIPWNKGKKGECTWKLSIDTKLKQSMSKKGVRLSESHKASLSISHMGKVRSEQSKLKQSESIKKSNPNICPHCGYTQRGNGIYKYHFDKCNQKFVN
jgi:hypothetical protein